MVRLMSEQIKKQINSLITRFANWDWAGPEEAPLAR